MGHHDESIANISLDIIGSFGLEAKRDDVTKWLARFHSDLFNDPLEQAELTDEIEKFIQDHGNDFIDEEND